MSSRPPTIACVRDEGADYDAPLESVCDYLLKVGAAHGRAHAQSLQSVKVRATPCGPVVSCEVVRGGESRKIIARSTDYPPLAVVNEEVGGDYAGSRLVFVYTPVGRRTRVDVFARMVSTKFSKLELERQTREVLASPVSEDVAALRAYLAEERGSERDTGGRSQP